MIIEDKDINVINTNNVMENIYPICFLDLGYRSDDFKSLLGNKKRNSLDSMINIL